MAMDMSMEALELPKYRAFSKYNNAPGTGKTAGYNIPPNNYDFYSEEEKYKPHLTGDGGIFSDWESMYNPTSAEADADREKAHEAGVPHGLKVVMDKFKDQPTIKLLVRSELHKDEEYGGPFWIEVSPKMRVRDLRRLIQDYCAVPPGSMKLGFAGKRFEDAERTLEHYGVKYWNNKFPDWPLVIRRY